MGGLLWAVELKGKAARLLALPRWYGVNALAGIVVFTFLDNVMSRVPIGLKADQTAYGAKEFLNDHLFRSFLSDRNASWAYSVVAILSLSLLFRFFHSKKLFFKI